MLLWVGDLLVAGYLLYRVWVGLPCSIALTLLLVIFITSSRIMNDVC